MISNRLEAVRTINTDSLFCLNRTVTGQLQDSRFKPPPATTGMAKEKDKKEQPLVSMNREQREDVWDDVYVKEEGIVLEFDPESNTGKIRAISDNNIYNIDSRELVRTRIQLQSGDKVFFAPFEDPDGNDFARIIRIIELKIRGGRVCLDSLKQFLSDKLLCLMPLPASEVV